VQFGVPDDGRENRLKPVERLTEINKVRNFASCWLYYKNASVKVDGVPAEIKIFKFLDYICDREAVFILN